MLTKLQKQTAQAIVNIFETGRCLGDYGRVTLLPGDAGHLTYGRSQTTLASGNLHILIKAYCEAPGAAFSRRLLRYLPGLAARDVSLDQVQPFRVLLAEAGTDPVMHDVQDRFFDRVYWEPSITVGAALGIGSPLGAAVIYDSQIHGGWLIIRRRTEQRHGAVADLREHLWVKQYVAERRDWLVNHPKPLLHATVYRMDTFSRLIEAAAWALPLPLRIRGVTVDEEILSTSPPVRASAAADDERTLLLRRPLLRGGDVEAIQRALGAAGFPLRIDGAFGRRTDRAVRAFQQRHGLKVDGIVGPATRAALERQG